MTENTDIIRAHYAASDAGDLPGMLAPLADDVSWTEMAGFPYAGTYHGPQAVAENAFARIATEWDGYRLDVDEIFDARDVQVALGWYSGTHRGTGRHFRCRVAHVWRLRDGRVHTFEQFTDTALVQAAVRAD